MTPEEKAVIEAAIAERNSLWNLFATGKNSPLVSAIDALIESRGTVEPLPIWTPATFWDVMPGDRVRIGTQEADVTKVSRGSWHARNREWIDDSGKVRDHQTPWNHEELNIDLSANPGMHSYDPDVQVEILADETRRAAMLLHDVFPGTKPVD